MDFMSPWKYAMTETPKFIMRNGITAKPNHYNTHTPRCFFFSFSV